MTRAAVKFRAIIMPLFGKEITADRSWRENFIGMAARFEAHIQECERIRKEDLAVQEARHLENRQRLDRQDVMIGRLSDDVHTSGEKISKQLFHSIATVLGVLIAMVASLAGFVITHLPLVVK